MEKKESEGNKDQEARTFEGSDMETPDFIRYEYMYCSLEPFKIGCVPQVMKKECQGHTTCLGCSNYKMRMKEEEYGRRIESGI